MIRALEKTSKRNGTRFGYNRNIPLTEIKHTLCDRMMPNYSATNFLSIQRVNTKVNTYNEISMMHRHTDMGG